MTEISPAQHRFNWHLPVLAAAIALVLFIPLELWATDFGPLFYFFLAAPIVCLILAIALFRSNHQKLAIASMLPIYCALSWVLFRNSLDIRSQLRWIFQSRDYKTKLLAQSNPSTGELRHVEWDGWGWASSDTTVYLVYDPNNTLENDPRYHTGGGKFNGIPCPVWGIHRLEPHWYTVVSLTDSTWSECDSTP
jgi:hypothetical protein